MESLVIRNLVDDYEKASQYVETLLRRCGVTDIAVLETLLVFEAVCQKIFENPSAEGPVVQICGRERLGYVSVRMTFEGGLFVLDRAAPGEVSPEDRILRAYADKVDHSYFSGHNRINITVRRGSFAAMQPCLIGMGMAFVLYALFSVLAGPETKQMILDSFISPVEKLCINAVLMVGTPITFVSFLKNMTDIYILSESNSSVRRFQRESMISSIVAILLAVLCSLILMLMTGHHSLVISSSFGHSIRMVLSEGVDSLIPSDIIAPFMTTSPFPLVLVAILVLSAMCYSGGHFDNMKSAIETGYALFSRMLSIVTYAMPFFVFIAFLDILCSNGLAAVMSLLTLMVIILLSIAVMGLYYALRLRRSRIPIRPFVQKMIPLLYENWKIGSAIDAVPFNIRYCIRHFRLNRSDVDSALPVLAQINLDGNCFCISLIALVFMFTNQESVHIMTVILIATVIFFLSLGAPNQPGSMLIAFSLIMKYIQSSRLMALAIICEMLFGTFVNLINVTGDIVSVIKLKYQ